MSKPADARSGQRVSNDLGTGEGCRNLDGDFLRGHNSTRTLLKESLPTFASVISESPFPIRRIEHKGYVPVCVKFRFHCALNIRKFLLVIVKPTSRHETGFVEPGIVVNEQFSRFLSDDLAGLKVSDFQKGFCCGLKVFSCHHEINIPNNCCGVKPLNNLKFPPGDVGHIVKFLCVSDGVIRKD